MMDLMALIWSEFERVSLHREADVLEGVVKTVGNGVPRAACEVLKSFVFLVKGVDVG